MQSYIHGMEGLEVDCDFVMVTLDVTALYTNILHNEAHMVVQNVLNSCTDKTPPTHFLLDLLDLILG